MSAMEGCLRVCANVNPNLREMAPEPAIDAEAMHGSLTSGKSLKERRRTFRRQNVDRGGWALFLSAAGGGRATAIRRSGVPSRRLLIVAAPIRSRSDTSHAVLEHDRRSGRQRSSAVRGTARLSNDGLRRSTSRRPTRMRADIAASESPARVAPRRCGRRRLQT